MPRREDNLARVRDTLQLLPLAEEVAGQSGTHIRVLFQPTFQKPGCLTLHIQEQASTVEFVLLRPALHWATAPVPAAALERFQGAVAGIALAGLGDTRPSNGRDGMLIDGEVVEDGVAGTFAAWSPTAAEEPATYQVCMALLDLGRACLPDEPSQTGLGHIQGYLHLR